MPAPVPATIQYKTRIIDPGANLTVSVSGSTVTAEYDDFWSSTVEAHCTVVTSYTNITNTVDAYGRVTVSGDINPVVLTRQLVDPTYTSYQLVRAWMDGTETFSQIILSASSGTYTVVPGKHFSVTIDPDSGSVEHTVMAVEFYNRHNGVTNPAWPADHFYIGMFIVNPNDPDYRPGKIWSGSTWLSHNRNGGNAKIYLTDNNMATNELRTIAGGVGQSNPPFIQTDANTKYNQRLIGQE